MPAGLDEKMANGDGDALSSSSISSPPVSPQNQDTIHVSRLPSSASHFSGEGVVHPASATPARANNASTITTTTSAASTIAAANGTAAKKPKAPRKKKEVPLGPDGKPLVEEKPKKPRKPREPKDKAAAAGSSTAAAPRKKLKVEAKAEEVPKATQQNTAVTAQARQPTITEMVGAMQPQPPASSTTPISTPTPAPAQPHLTPQHRNSDATMCNNLALPVSNPPTPRPISSGQNYDPIRGQNYDPIRGSTVPPRPSDSTPSQPTVARVSGSPSIASLIDGPSSAIKQQPSHAISHPPQTSMRHPTPPSRQFSSPPSSTKPAYGPFSAPVSQQAPTLTASAGEPMEIVKDEPPALDVQDRSVPEIKAPSKASSSPAPTPKAARPTPEPPKGTGSGLLSSSTLFGGPGSAEPSERQGVNIDLHISLNPKGGNNINIAQEIIKKYGRDAINPRAAAHREQLLRIAAEQDRLGGASNDDMSVDNLSEMEGDSNIEMGGMDDEKSATGADADGTTKTTRKRKKKVEEYDKEDDFIDDTELAWQEGAAVAKDGFFVYSGPLVPEGQTAQVESTAPTRGGRGRGRGSRGGRAGANSGTTHASLADKSRDSTTTSTTTTTTPARGRGSRGGRGAGATRKPRITKADKEKMESEKMDRERSAANVNGASPAAPTGSAHPLAAPPQVMSSATTHQSPPQQQNGHGVAQAVGGSA